MLNKFRFNTSFIWLAVTASFFGCGCAHKQIAQSTEFTDRVSGAGKVTLLGWAQLAGELVLYSDQNSLREDRLYPYCISGVFKDQYERDLVAYDGKRVIVVGQLTPYSSLDYEDNSPLPRRMLEGIVIPNWCFGDNVILINSIQLAE